MGSESLVDALATYRRLVASRYRAIKPGELGDLPAGELWLSPKIDGELAGIEFKDGTARLTTKGGKELPDSPLLRELERAGKRTQGPMRIVGELHCRPEGDARPRVGDVGSALAGSGPLRDRLAFAGFDLLPIGHGLLPSEHGTRLEAIKSAFAELTCATAVESVRTEDRAEIRAMWQKWGASGRAEGVVARTADGRIYKIKPDISIDAVIMAFTTRCDAPSQVRSILLGLARAEGTFQLIGGLGGVGGIEQREQLLAVLAKAEAPSALRQPSSDGGIFRFVRPQVVAEVNCTDIQAEDSAGEQLQRWIMRFDGTSWQGLSMAPGVSLLHPQLVRLRPDKQATDAEAGYAQIAQRCAPPPADAGHAKAAGSPVLHGRRVWTKSAKDKVAVRKLLIWRTGRDGHGDWPAWIIHFTDYSPDRKTPLERTFRTARTQMEAEAVAERLVADNVKKGWEQVDLQGEP
jgi:hypothetical protein